MTIHASRAVKVYIAGPLEQGNVADNIAAACRVAADLLVAGYDVYLPHLDFWLRVNQPQLTRGRLIAHDLSWILTCDLVCRLPGESPGADLETECARRHSIPVVGLDLTKPIAAQLSAVFS